MASITNLLIGLLGATGLVFGLLTWYYKREIVKLRNGLFVVTVSEQAERARADRLNLHVKQLEKARDARADRERATDAELAKIALRSSAAAADFLRNSVR